MSNPKAKPKLRGSTAKCPIAQSTFTTYMDEGIMHYRAGHYRKALFCFDRALELKPSNKSALVARSQCHLKLGDASSALKDAETSFDRNDVFIRGLFQYAESLFALGLFERSLIAYQTGFRCRRDMDEFRIGVQKCREAILTAIGHRSATQIEDFNEILPLIVEMDELQRAKKEHCCIRPGSSQHKKKPSKLKAPSKARQKWVAREVLNRMYFDKKYLKKFLNRPDVQSEQGSSFMLRGHATEALNYLKIRERFWRDQNPMYARKMGLNYNDNMVLRYEEQEKAKLEASRKIKSDAALGAVQKNISLIEHALSINRAKDCQLECERTMRQMIQISTTLLPRKQEFLCKILNFKGIALCKLKKYDQAIESFQEELQIAIDNKMPEFKGQALDALGRAYAMKKSYSEAAESWEQKLISSKSALEKAYLFHEIGRCYFEMNKIELCRHYAQHCLEEAQKISDNIWMMNARIFLGQIEVKSMNLHSALLHFEAGEDLATAAENSVNNKLLREAQQCLKVWIEKREKDELEQQSMMSLAEADSDDDIHETRSLTPESVPAISSQ